MLGFPPFLGLMAAIEEFVAVPCERFLEGELVRHQHCQLWFHQETWLRANLVVNIVWKGKRKVEAKHRHGIKNAEYGDATKEEMRKTSDDSVYWKEDTSDPLWRPLKGDGWTQQKQDDKWNETCAEKTSARTSRQTSFEFQDGFYCSRSIKYYKGCT